MLPYFWYILKVIICSGILFGYYWLFLRNKVFHQYNRFYLLAALTLSLVLPLLKINFWQAEQQSDMIRALQVVSVGDEYMNNVIVTADRGWSIQQLSPLVYWMVSFIFLLVLLQTVFIIRSLLKKYPVQLVDNFAFINTNDKSTPFSFLKYIFWNDEIDLDTPTGKQIFKHEVAHIQEKHTYDKLLINILLIFFWCNPFFWLYRKELNMIHEFIADKKAVEDSDTASFAAMILQAAYPQHRFQLTNNFFYSPIKRRLLMLTKNNNPRVNYLGRVMVLPLAALIFAAFSFKTKELRKENDSTSDTHTNIAALTMQNDTIPFTIFVNTKHADEDYLKSEECKTQALVIVDSKEIGNLGSNYLDNSSKKYSSAVIYGPAEAKKIYGEKGSHGVIKLTQKDIVVVSADSVFYDEKNQSIKLSGTNTTLAGDLSNTLIYVNNKVISPEELNAIPPAKISSINILKGDKLDEIVEAKGRTAVIYVSLKPDDMQEVVVTSSRLKNEATPFISLDKFSVLYIGIDNPITVAAPGIPNDQLLVDRTTNNVMISGRNGKYIARVTAVGEATITVSTIKNDQRVILSAQTFQIKRIPDPTDPDFPDELKRIYKLDSSYKLQSDNNQKLMEEQKYLSKLDQTQSEVRALTAASDAEKTVIEKKIQGQQLQLLKQKIILDEQNKTNRTLNKIQLEVNEKDLVAEKAMTERKLTDQELHYLKQKIILDEQNKTIPWTTHLNLQKIQFDQKELLAQQNNLVVEKAMVEKKLTIQEQQYLKQKLLLEDQNKTNLVKTNLNLQKMQLEQKEFLVQQDNRVFTKAEVSPQFTGGEEAWKKYLRANLNNSTPLDNRAPAGKYTVVLKFIVKTDGSISDVTCENDPGFGTCAEALRIIKLTPKWQPAIQNGKKVNAWKRQPITWLVQE